MTGSTIYKLSTPTYKKNSQTQKPSPFFSICTPFLNFLLTYSVFHIGLWLQKSPPNKEHQVFHWVTWSQDVQELILHCYTHLDLKFLGYLGTLLKRLCSWLEWGWGGGPKAQHFSACFDFLTQLEYTQKLQICDSTVTKMLVYLIKAFTKGMAIMRSL